MGGSVACQYGLGPGMLHRMFLLCSAIAWTEDSNVLPGLLSDNKKHSVCETYIGIAYTYINNMIHCA